MIRWNCFLPERMIADTYTNLSHDIRTPLTSLDGYFQLLREEEDPERQEHYIQIIQERIASLKDMLEELFLFTKVKNASFQLEGTVGCVNRILKQTVFSYYEEWKKMQIEPTVDLCPEPVYALFNEQALRRVFQNMIKNSIVHGKRDIYVRMYTGDAVEVPAVYVSISNDVEHPEAIDPQKVFERFYKADEARSVASSGLGLAIAKELVERMGGGIEAKIAKGRFAVILWLPVAEAPEPGKSANHPMFAPN